MKLWQWVEIVTRMQIYGAIKLMEEHEGPSGRAKLHFSGRSG